jgi:hypothetical protein
LFVATAWFKDFLLWISPYHITSQPPTSDPPIPDQIA